MTNTKRIAALYVQEGGVYCGLDDVDPWPESRDARTYPGPWPVVAHPPCNRWAMPLAKVNETRYGHRVGDDGGCFASAVAAVQRFGGVLEHPANSAAFAVFGIPRPRPGWRAAWVPSLLDAHRTIRSWICQVAQVAYGHPCRKRTWLYYVGDLLPPELDWSEPPHRAVTSRLQRTTTDLPRITGRRASATPAPFRDILIAMARMSRAQ